MKLEQPLDRNMSNFFQYSHSAWDRYEKQQIKKPKFPTTLEGMSDTARQNLNRQRHDWLKNLGAVMTDDMRATHDLIEECLDDRGYGSPECVGLVGEPNVGKTTIIQRFTDDFHCRHSEGRPLENRPEDVTDYPPVPVVSLTASNTVQQQLEAMLRFYGFDPGKRPTNGWLLGEVQQKVVQYQTQLVVIDDVHNLGGKTPATQFKVMYETLGDVVFLFTRTKGDPCPIIDPKRGGGQTTERTHWLEIEEPTRTSEEWARLVIAFEKQMPWCHTKRGSILKPHAALIHDKTLGKAGRVAKLLTKLTKAMIRSNEGGEDTVTAEMIDSVRVAK